MGLTHVTVRVCDLAKQGKPFEAEFLVDTGAIDCLAKQEDLLNAGVVPEGKAVYQLANGQPAEFDYGYARLTFLGDETVCKIIFGSPEAEPILGVIALEGVGIVVDPNTNTLRRLHARPLKYALPVRV